MESIDGMSELNQKVQDHDIEELGLIVKIQNEPTYVDFEIEGMGTEMKRQLFRQLCSLVYTYKTANGVIWPDEVNES